MFGEKSFISPDFLWWYQINDLTTGILANLGFEEIGLDLYVVLVLAALSIYLWWRHGSQPLFIYYGTAYIKVAGYSIKI